MVQKKILRCCQGFFMRRCTVFSLHSRLGLPQWILSRFQAPPLADHTAALKGFSEHQRKLCDVAFLSEHYNLWSSPPPLMKSPATLAPTAIFNDLPKTHSGFNGTVHHRGRVEWHTWSLLSSFWSEQSHSPSFSPSVPTRGGWCESGGRQPEPQITALCASMAVWLAAPHKILFTAHTGESYSSNPLQKEGNHLTWQHLEWR